MENIERLTYEEYVILLTALVCEDKVLQEIYDQRLVKVTQEIRRKVKVLAPEELQ